jgi:hypothetical protein
VDGAGSASLRDDPGTTTTAFCRGSPRGVSSFRLRRWSLERVDDVNALEVFESGQVLRVQNVNASFDTRREDQGVPELRSSSEMDFLCAGQVAVGGQDERQKIPELAETTPGVRRVNPCLSSLREAARNSQVTCHKSTLSRALVMRSSAIF